MGKTLKQIVLIAAAVGLAGAIWFVLTTRKPARAGDQDIAQSALCSSCGHYMDTTQSVLASCRARTDYLPAMSPGDGPGYQCPNCKKETLYANPIVCGQCGNKFFLSRNEYGGPVARCPKCKWER